MIRWFFIMMNLHVSTVATQRMFSSSDRRPLKSSLNKRLEKNDHGHYIIGTKSQG